MFEEDDIDSDAIAGLTWFTKSEYRKLLRKAPDRDELIPDYKAWLERMHAIKDRSSDKGAVVVRVPVTVEEMSLWCNRNGCIMDHEGRTAYTQARLRELAESGVLDSEIAAQQGDTEGTP
jgi:hypothetical protein